MMLDKKANSSDFLIRVQNGSESSGDNSHQQCIWPKTANGFIVQWWFKTFCKGDKGLEDEENSGRPLEVDKNQLRAITEADPLKATRESRQRTQCHLFYGHSAFEANWKGEKSSISGCLMS